MGTSRSQLNRGKKKGGRERACAKLLYVGGKELKL